MNTIFSPIQQTRRYRPTVVSTVVSASGFISDSKPRLRHLWRSALVLSCFLVVASLSGCDTFLDVNKNPNFPDRTSPSALLPGIISNGSQQYFLSALSSAHFTQHIASRQSNNGLDVFALANPANPFNDTYFRVCSNIIPMNDVATKEGSWHYVGAGKTLMAMWLFHLTDVHGDIPYSQAFNGATDFTPTYDKQQDLYPVFLGLLDEAVVEFNKPTSLRGLNERSADLFFGGNVTRWKRLAFALKARQLNHLTKKATYNPQAVLAALDSGLASNADDAQLSFAGQTIDGNTNPWGTRRNNAALRTFGRYFINMMNGMTLGAPDPRLNIIAPRNRGGVVNGSGEASTPVPNRTDFYGIYNTSALPPNAPDTAAWYARNDGAQFLFTFAEQKFIEAEAAFRAGNRPRAFAAYQAGITAHCAKLGVPMVAITAYLTSRAVAQDMGVLTLKNIMEQKYIALFLHPEAWVDMRRFDYSPDIYTNFQLPVGIITLANMQFPRRFLPGATEILYNPVNARREFQGFADYEALLPMWWDKP
jgi:hypothetical protein